MVVPKPSRLLRALNWLHEPPSKDVDIGSIVGLIITFVGLMYGPILQFRGFWQESFCWLVAVLQVLRLLMISDIRWRAIMAWLAAVLNAIAIGLICGQVTYSPATGGLIGLEVICCLHVTKFSFWFKIYERSAAFHASRNRSDC